MENIQRFIYETFMNSLKYIFMLLIMRHPDNVRVPWVPYFLVQGDYHKASLKKVMNV